MKPFPFQILHILAPLGAAGMTASFFFVVNYMTAHPGNAFIDFNTLLAHHFGKTDALNLLIQTYIGGIVLSAFLHFFLLFRWFRGFNRFRQSAEYTGLKASNKEVQLMAIPLTLTMTMNVLFILGALFIPGLFDPVTWVGMQAQLIDFLFVGAGVYFIAMLVLALKIFSVYWLRLVHGNLDFSENANLSQLIAIFSFAMIAVGLGALGFSKVPWIALVGMSLSYIVLGMTAILAGIKLVLGFKSMFKQGISAATSVTLLLPVVIIGMFVVGLYRADIANMHALQLERNVNYHLLVFTVGAGISVLVGLFGLMVMKRSGFFKQMAENRLDASSFAMVCPGFGFEVQLVLWLNIGLVYSGLVEFGSSGYFALWVPLILVQLTTIYFLLRLLRMHRFLKFERATTDKSSGFMVMPEPR